MQPESPCHAEPACWGAAYGCQTLRGKTSRAGGQCTVGILGATAIFQVFKIRLHRQQLYTELCPLHFVHGSQSNLAALVAYSAAGSRSHHLVCSTCPEQCARPEGVDCELTTNSMAEEEKSADLRWDWVESRVRHAFKHVKDDSELEGKRASAQHPCVAWRPLCRTP